MAEGPAAEACGAGIMPCKRTVEAGILCSDLCATSMPGGSLLPGELSWTMMLPEFVRIYLHGIGYGSTQCPIPRLFTDPVADRPCRFLHEFNNHDR